MVAVSMLIGFSAVMAALLSASLMEHVRTATDSASCSVSADLHRTGPGRAYIVASVSNTGSGTIRSVNMTLVDDDGTRRVIASNATLSLEPGQTWHARGAFAAQVSAGSAGSYGGAHGIMAVASVAGDSEVLCWDAAG